MQYTLQWFQSGFFLHLSLLRLSISLKEKLLKNFLPLLCLYIKLLLLLEVLFYHLVDCEAVKQKYIFSLFLFLNTRLLA